MLTILLSSNALMELSILSIIISPLLLLAGLIVYFSAKDENKKIGVKLMIASFILFIIGFGTCFANLRIDR